jgi:hypothetical protein
VQVAVEELKDELFEERDYEVGDLYTPDTDKFKNDKYIQEV